MRILQASLTLFSQQPYVIGTAIHLTLCNMAEQIWLHIRPVCFIVTFVFLLLLQVKNVTYSLKHTR